MRWNLDRSLARLEALWPKEEPGTALSRVSMALGTMKERGLSVTSEDEARGFGPVWMLVVGPLRGAKTCFWGRTAFEAYTKARKALITSSGRKKPREKKRRAPAGVKTEA